MSNRSGHRFSRNPPKIQSGWYCQACGYFTAKMSAKERALTCRRATYPSTNHPRYVATRRIESMSPVEATGLTSASSAKHEDVR